jgi:CRISPR-associated protein Csx10
VSTLTLTLRQPAQLGDRARKDYVLSTMEHIPGSVVRGALAARWLAEHGTAKPGSPEREEFLALFEGGVRYGALLRPGTEFMSLAVAGHKYDPRPDCETIDYDRAAGGEPPLYCPDCDSPVEQRRGLTSARPGDRPATRRRTSVAIGAGGVARRGALFTRETLDPGQIFSGTVTAKDDTLLKILAGLGPVRIGGRRTTHGLADLAITNSTGASGTKTPGPERRTDGDLVLRLRSPGIFTDAQGRPSRDPSPEELSEVLGVPARVVRRWTRWEQAGGWHAASGLPKPQELTVAAGSTYIIHPERNVDDTVLDALSRRGVGLRRHEGFGDLAPPPALRQGRAAVQAEAARRRKRDDDVRPLIRLLAEADRWRARIRAHVAGDAQATVWLRGLAAKHPESDIRSAMTVFLGLPQGDQANVLAFLEGELGR